MNARKLVAILTLIVILISSADCSNGQKNDLTAQTAVVRGDLTVKVNGSGKTAYATDARMAFYTAGKIETLNVKEGDRVTKGAVLAKLDTRDLELALSQARVEVAQSEKALKQAQIGVSQTEISLTQAQISLSQAQASKIQAEVSLTAAQFNLDAIKAVGDIKDKIMKVQIGIDSADENRRIAGAIGDTATLNYLNQRMIELNAEKNILNTDLQKLLGKEEFTNVAPYEIMIYDPTAQTYTVGGETYDRLIVEDIRLKQQQADVARKGLEVAQENIDQANQNIVMANQNIDLARQTVDQAQLIVEHAQKAVQVAQKQLDDATITAPFDGIAAEVNIHRGDFILTPGLSSGTPIYLVDPDSLEVQTEIDEIDVANVLTNQQAVIKLDAFLATNITGTVTSISVTPKVGLINSGVVVYKVKVSFNAAPGVQIKSGMSANVDVVTSEKKNVLLIPNNSIKHNTEGQTIVEVFVNQKVEERQIKTGLTDGVQTEVIDGLQVGDIIVK